MNSFDLSIVRFFNQFAGNSWLFDKFFVVISTNLLLKGGVLITLVWFLWFGRDDASQSRRREHLLATIVGCGVALVLARMLAVLLPFRFRPVHTETLAFKLPIGTTPTLLEGWSAFPSDHAVLFFALSSGLWFVSRRLGLFAIVYTALVIAFPRIYLGLHFPTDIIAGALIGGIVVVVANRLLTERPWIGRIASFADTHPQWFYSLFFLLTYQIANMFTSARSVLGAAATVLQGGP